MFRAVQRNVFVRWRDTAQLGVPALCYLLQNRLLFVALSRLSATGHQLWSQSKTLFTALFFVRILGQSILPVQWVALALLTVGVGLVQLGEISGAATSSAAAAAGGGVAASSLIGVGAVLASSVLSGFANIYLEKILKQAECETDAEGCEVHGAAYPCALAREGPCSSSPRPCCMVPGPEGSTRADLAVDAQRAIGLVLDSSSGSTPSSGLGTGV